MHRPVGCLVAAVCLLVAGAAAAEGAPGRHGGPYARVGLSGNYLSLTGGDQSITGLGSGFSLAAGHAVAPNLFLFAAFDYDLALDPDMELRGRRQVFDGLSVSYLAVGPGGAYYLPSDFYLSLTVSWASVSVTTDAVPDADAWTGFGARIGVGKEWTLAAPFALGVGANFFVGNVTRESESRTPMAVGLAISGLYD